MPARIGDQVVQAALEGLDLLIPGCAQQLVSNFEAMLDELRQPRPESPTILRCHCELLVLELLRCRQSTALPSHGSRTFRRILQHIESRHEDFPSIKQLSSELGISHTRIGQLFRRHTGQSPSQYLMRQRLSRARQLLREGNLPITEIAYRLGFSSSQHFATCFRHHVGMTPSDFRSGFCW